MTPQQWAGKGGRPASQHPVLVGLRADEILLERELGGGAGGIGAMCREVVSSVSKIWITDTSVYRRRKGEVRVRCTYIQPSIQFIVFE